MLYERCQTTSAIRTKKEASGHGTYEVTIETQSSNSCMTHQAAAICRDLVQLEVCQKQCVGPFAILLVLELPQRNDRPALYIRV